MFNSQTPLISVVTIYYNRLNNLTESINSVLNQTYSNIEFIILDDSSTDGTAELISSFKDPRIIFLRPKKKLGFTKGLIYAISYVKGDFIAIHGAGDISFNVRLEKQFFLLNSNPRLGIVGCFYEDVFRGDIEVISPVNDHNSHSFSHGEVMFTKEAYLLSGGYNSHYYFGQFSPFLKELLKSYDHDFVPEVLYRRFHFENGVTNNTNKKIDQHIFYNIGVDVSDLSFLWVDNSYIIVEKSLRLVRLIKFGSLQEKLLIFHLKNRNWYFTLFLYKLYRFYIFPSIIIESIGFLMGKLRNRRNKKIKKYFDE